MLQDLRFALRLVLRQRGFSLLAVSTLGLAIGTTAALFAVVDALLLQEAPYPRADRLVTVWGHSRDQGQARDVLSGRNFLDFQERSRTFESMAAYKGGGATLLLADGDPTVVDGLRVTAGFFDVLGVEPFLGRAFLPEDGRAGAEPVAVISHAVWQRLFGGSHDILGRRVEVVDGSYRIVGVLPREFRFPQAAGFNVALDVDWMRTLRRTAIDYWIVGRLRDGASPGGAQADLDAIHADLTREEPRLGDWGVRVEAFQAPLYEFVRPAAVKLMALTLLALAIASANVAILLAARAIRRRGEIAVRVALGAGRRRLCRQLLVESLVLGTLGAAVALVVAHGTLAVLPALLPSQVPIPGSAATAALPAIGVNGPVIGVTVAASLLAAVLFSLPPLLQVWRVQPFAVLRSANVAGGKPARGRRDGLVVAQLALAVVLLSSAIFTMRATLRLLAVDPGVDPTGVLTAYFGELNARDDPERALYLRQVLERVAAVPGVQALGVNDYVPFQQEDDFAAFRLSAAPPDRVQRVEWRRVSSGYFEAAGIRLLRGRGFTAADDERGPSVVVINQALADRFFAGGDAVGRRIELASDAYGDSEIVGVVADVRRRGLHQPAPPVLYVPYQRRPRPVVALFVRADGDPRALIEPVREAIWTVDPRQPVERIRPLSGVIADSVLLPRLEAQIVAAVALVSVLLAAVGVYGVISHSVSQRRRELGIRIALGSTPRGIVRLVLVGGVRRIAAGLAAGLGAAIITRAAALRLQLGGLERLPSADAMGSALESMLLAVAVVTGMALVACYIPARHAARADPSFSLRNE